MDLGAPPERVAAKDKVAGSLGLHVVPEEWQEASPLNQNKPSHNQPPRHPTNERTNKHTNTQPSKRTKQPTTKNRQTNKLKKTCGWNHSLLFPIMVTMPLFN